MHPFGHPRVLVQLLKKSGYSCYLFCRPDANGLVLPDNDFVWVGYNGIEILVNHAIEHDNSDEALDAELPNASRNFIRMKKVR